MDKIIVFFNTLYFYFYPHEWLLFFLVVVLLFTWKWIAWKLLKLRPYMPIISIPWRRVWQKVADPEGKPAFGIVEIDKKGEVVPAIYRKTEKGWQKYTTDKSWADWDGKHRSGPMFAAKSRGSYRPAPKSNRPEPAYTPVSASNTSQRTQRNQSQRSYSSAVKGPGDEAGFKKLETNEPTDDMFIYKQRGRSFHVFVNYGSTHRPDWDRAIVRDLDRAKADPYGQKWESYTPPAKETTSNASQGRTSRKRAPSYNQGSARNYSQNRRKVLYDSWWKKVLIGILLVLIIGMGAIWTMNTVEYMTMNPEERYTYDLAQEQQKMEAETVSAESEQSEAVDENQTGFKANKLTVDFGISVGMIVVILIIFFLYLEVATRHERLLLDFWITLVTVAAIMARDIVPETWWFGFIFLAAGFTIYAVASNEEEGSSQFGHLDFTTTMVEAGLLIIIYMCQWESLPYPEYIPIWAVWMVFVFSLAFELYKIPWMGFFAIASGIVSGVLFSNVFVITVLMAVVIVIASRNGRKDWVQGSHSKNKGDHKMHTQHEMDFAGVSLQFIIPWDAVLFQLFAYGITALIIYGNANILEYIPSF